MRLFGTTPRKGRCRTDGAQRSFEYEYLLARLTEVQEAIDSLSDDDQSLGVDGRRRLLELAGRLRSAVTSYELDDQTRSVSRR